MVVGTLSLGQKGQTSGCITEWMHWNSDIWWWGQCLWCKKVKPVDAVCSGHSGCSGIVVYGGLSTVYCIHCIDWFDLFAPKTLSPPPYITITMHPLCNASTGLTFLYQRQCPTTIYHYSTVSTAYCIHCVHLFDLFVSKTMSPPPYTTIPLCPLRTVYCIHCFDLFVSKTMSPPPHTTIPLRTASTAYCVHCVLCRLCDCATEATGLTFLHQRQCPHHHIPLFHCIHCALHTASTAYFVHCVHCVTASTESTGLTFLYQRQCPRHTIPLFYCILHPLRPLV